MSATTKPTKSWRIVNELELMQLVNRQSKIANGSWLPDMDLNHDKQIQSLLCYRYTIGQAGALARLNSFVGQSSCQTVSLRQRHALYARPHPGPLPRGEGEVARVIGKFAHRSCSRRFSAVCANKRTMAGHFKAASDRQMILPLLGERAGVRVVVTTNYRASRITHHACRDGAQRRRTSRN